MHKLPFIGIAAVLFGFMTCQSDTHSVMNNDKLLADSLRTDSLDYQAKMAAWVDAQFNKMNEDQRLGQLFMLGAYPSNGAADEARVLAAIQNQQVGGLIFFKTTPTYMVNLVNKYQAKSNVPLLIAIDGEWGAAMRVDTAIDYPRQMTLGAITDNTILYEFGKQVAKECKMLGIHINFAPVVDVNNNPKNPVIGDRSFGDDRENVAQKAYSYMKGMQDGGILACAKHFPGHGDTDVDSHYDLPKLMHSAQRLDSLELYPFKYLISKGVASIMVAHLEIPAYDTTPHVPATLSPKIVQGLLKEQLGYQGLVITDGLNMQGVTKHFQNGETDVRALLAGNDILLVPQDIPVAIKAIKQAVADKKITMEEINNRVKKILRAKYQVGLATFKPLVTKDLAKNLASIDAEVLEEKLVANSLTLLNNDQQVVPILQNKASKVATLCINCTSKTTFQQELEKYGVSQHFYAGSSIVGKQETKYLALKNYEVVLVPIYNISKSPDNQYNISPTIPEFLKKLSKLTKVMVINFGSPYSVQYFDSLSTVAVAYSESKLAQQLTAQAVFGGIPFTGKLPITASPIFKYGTGVSTTPIRLPYALKPEAVGLNSLVLKKIDNIANEAIREKATPGCQVLVVKNGKIAFHKTYGHHTYDRTRTVKMDDIYDLASVTKIAAATLSIMKLTEEGKISLDEKLSTYLPELVGTNKENLLIKEIMAHQAGLKPWIPFYLQTLDSLKKPQPKYYLTKPQEGFKMRIAENLYLRESAIDSIVWQRIYNAEQNADKNYVYSDLGFYLFTKLVHKASGKTLDQYAHETFYKPMGLSQIGYNPLKMGIPKGRIVPTEQDTYFRYQTIHGDVHDMGSAMIGGVSGHAGLFATATDLAAIMQLFVNEGHFHGKRYLDSTTVQKFTAQYASTSRRALGFDRKEKSDDGKKSVNVAYQASDKTFGHLGFTGIGAWADPDNDLVFIFLSNRTYPSMENNKLNTKNIRPRIHEIVYEAIMK